MTEDQKHLEIDQYLRQSDINPMIKIVDLDKVQKLIAEDHVVDKQEVELLFQLNQQLGAGDEQNDGWANFFVTVVARAVVFDLESPGEIDEHEGNWLGDIFEKNSVGNQSERLLIDEINKTASSISGKLGALIRHT